MRESDDYLSVVLEVKVSKLIDMESDFMISLSPTSIRIHIKRRLLQLTIPEEVRNGGGGHHVRSCCRSSVVRFLSRRAIFVQPPHFAFFQHRIELGSETFYGDIILGNI